MDNGTPWVSFCMSTYKRGEILHKQIESILAQSFTNFELIISDNDIEGSGGPIAEQFNDKRIDYQVNRENLGMVKSFNHSLSKAKGEYVVMITDDDPIYPDMLQTLYDLHQQHPGYGVYHGGGALKSYTALTAKLMRE